MLDRRRIGKPKVYLAGPEVFLEEAVEIGRRKKEICGRYGAEGFFPFDNEIEFVPAGDRVDRAIYRANVDMMQRADCAIVNLTPFRGYSADVGSVFELGMMAGMNKPVLGYSNVTTDLLTRIRSAGSALAQADGTWLDAGGMTIEDYGNSDNLMIDGCLAEQGHPLVTVEVRPENLFRDLRGFEACLRILAARPDFSGFGDPAPGGEPGRA